MFILRILEESREKRVSGKEDNSILSLRMVKMKNNDVEASLQKS